MEAGEWLWGPQGGAHPDEAQLPVVASSRKKNDAGQGLGEEPECRQTPSKRFYFYLYLSRRRPHELSLLVLCARVNLVPHKITLLAFSGLEVGEAARVVAGKLRGGHGGGYQLPAAAGQQGEAGVV
jgi:hypothetical protein